VFTEPFPNNSCSSGSTVLVLRKYATIFSVTKPDTPPEFLRGVPQSFQGYVGVML
jgi:hypothetical protein